MAFCRNCGAEMSGAKFCPSCGAAAEGDVVAVYMNMKDFVFNSNMVMSVVQWTDHDTNKKKTKVMLICDGKIADANGVILVKKGA